MWRRTPPLSFSPYRDRSVYVFCAVLLAVAVPLIQVDRPFSSWLHQSMMPWDPWLQRLTNLGEGWFLASACILPGAALWLFRSRYWHGCALALAGLVVSLAPTHLLKWVLGRPRPYLAGDTRFDGLDFTQLNWFADTHDFRSFPSGHSSAIFSVLWIAASAAPSRWLRFTLLFVASLVCMSRVALAKHFLADVLAGAAIGIAVAQALIGVYQRTSKASVSPPELPS